MIDLTQFNDQIFCQLDRINHAFLILARLECGSHRLSNLYRPKKAGINDFRDISKMRFEHTPPQNIDGLDRFPGKIERPPLDQPGAGLQSSPVLNTLSRNTRSPSP
jgi:hypothetical protein